MLTQSHADDRAFMLGPLRQLLGAEFGGYWDARRGLVPVSGAVNDWNDLTFAGDDDRRLVATPGSANRPTFNPVGFNGGPGVVFDGVVSNMQCALPAGSSIQGGSRPYWFVVGNWVVAGGGSTFLGCGPALPLASTFNRMGQAAATAFQQTRADSSGALNTNVGTPGTSRHLFEAGLTAGGTNTVVLDGTGANNAALTGTSGDWLALGIGSNGLLTPANFQFAAIIQIKNEPSSGVKTAIRTLIKGPQSRYPTHSYGLP